MLGRRGDIAIGNVYGSNIANLALVGGLVALISPLRVQASTLKREIPAMLGVALLLWPLLYNLQMGRGEGLLLLGIFVAMVVYTVRTAHGEAQRNLAAMAPDERPPAGKFGKNLTLVVAGLVGLTVGARLAIDGAVTIGSAIGLSDAVIGSTIMAVGTSLPELITCVVAALKGHHDISVGNLVGSNIFNTLLVTGTAGVVRPFAVGSRFAGGTDFWILIAVSAGFAVAAIVGRRVIGRVCGTLLLLTYVGYLVYLLTAAAPA